MLWFSILRTACGSPLARDRWLAAMAPLPTTLRCGDATLVLHGGRFEFKVDATSEDESLARPLCGTYELDGTAIKGKFDASVTKKRNFHTTCDWESMIFEDFYEEE